MTWSLIDLWQVSPALAILVRRLAVIAVASTSLAANSTPLPADEGSDFFERKIRPVLVQHCYECHAGGADVIQGGLRLDDPLAMARGGDSGAAVVAGNPDQSLLLVAMRYEQLEMPPSGPLDEKILQDFQHWIEEGAVDPREADPQLAAMEATEVDWQAARQFWSFQPPTTHQPPHTNDRQWAQRRIDSFVLAALERVGLQPNPTAGREVLIRRLSFDLTGLPPTPSEVDQFLRDNDSGAIERLVDRLLSSPAHAERWARLWLDVVRFAEDQAHVVGNNLSLTYPNAFRYRDWIVQALAADMSYRDFVRLQLAADLVAPDDPELHVALGFIGLGPKYYRRSSPEVMADEWEDRVDVVTRGLLGLTVACARCHDHKFDPIPTADYYALAGVFAGTEMFNRPLDDAKFGKSGEAEDPADAVHIVRESKPVDLNVFIRGDVNHQGPLAPRGFLRVLSPDDRQPWNHGSGRGDLADAILDSSNPLTARVIVNRVWAALIGNPLVGTPSNFGSLGQTPTHPELLDDLAVRFMDHDWSLKWLQREIVLSATYAQSSRVDDSKQAIDPENRWLWRMPRRRLSVEAYRDALLAVAGRLDHCIGGESIEPDEPASRRRTLYSRVSRLKLNPMLARFDFPDPNAHSPGRHETTTPLQKLYLLNSPFWIAQSEAFAGQIMATKVSLDQRIELAYRQLFARSPTDDEVQIGRSFVGDQSLAAWSQYLQTLMISNEMFMID